MATQQQLFGPNFGTSWTQKIGKGNKTRPKNPKENISKITAGMCYFLVPASNLPPVVQFLVTAMLRLLGLLQIWRLQALDNGLARVPAMGSLVMSGSVLGKIDEVFREYMGMGQYL